MTAPEWIAEARKRCAAATPGPWTEKREQGGDDAGYDGTDYATGKVWGPPAPPPLGGGEHYDEDDDTVLTCELGRDAEYVAAARTDLPRALDALDRVLALHVPEEPWPDMQPTPPKCDGCRAECQHCEGDHPWPCPTVRAIQGA